MVSRFPGQWWAFSQDNGGPFPEKNHPLINDALQNILAACFRTLQNVARPTLQDFCCVKIIFHQPPCAVL